MFKTAITEMFGVKYPIICGAMMWLCKPKMCAAVSNAGGIGNLTAANYETADEFRAAIRETRKLTDKPFFIAITLLPSMRITPEHHKMYVRICAEEKVDGIEFSGTPLDKVAGMEAVELLKNAGVRMFHKVGAVRHALHAQKIGFDGVYAAGIEEGGHPLNDDVTTMVLTRKMVSSLKIPVVSVGGIADGSGLAAALALGADGVMLAGCHPGECHYVDQNYKAMRRYGMIMHTLKALGIDEKRVRLVWASAAEGQQLAEAITELVGDVRKLGPLNWPDNWTDNKDRLEALEAIAKEHEEALEVEL